MEPPRTTPGDIAEFTARVAPRAGNLVIRGLSKRYADTRSDAVIDLDLAVGQGEFVTLLGPSGCGKTTTLRMIAGLERPTAGTIELDGEDLLAMSADQRPVILVFQSYALFPHLSVRGNVGYGLKLRPGSRAEKRREVDYALEAMDLAHLAERAPAQLSGGQQQRVALARAMVMKPKVLLFDEPLSNLDVKLRVQMRAEIRRLQQRLGITSIYVTHDQDEAMVLSDRIVVMRDGRIEQVDEPATIYLRPSSTFVADFVGRANFLPVSVVACDGDRVRVHVLGRELTVASHPDFLSARRQLLMIRPESIRIRPSTNADLSGGNAQVLNRTFTGSAAEYELETEVGNVVAVVPDPGADDLLAVGAMVELSFDPRRAWLLPSD